MSKVNMFEAATRKKMRFPYKGNATVEDLWDLSLTDLNIVYKTLKRKKKQETEENLDVLGDSKNDTEKYLDLQLEIVQYIANIKNDEAKTKEDLAIKKARDAKIKAILADKEDENLKSLSADELRKLLGE